MLQQVVRTGFMILFALFIIVRTADAVDTPAKGAFLMDAETGAVLMAKNPNKRVPPASMSKIMTALMVFERLQDGRLSLDDTFHVSEEAWRKGGSKMFVEVGTDIRVEDLLRGVIIQSGNDAAIVLAEGIAGTEEAFGEMMTQRAREIGAVNSTFRNATGWPDPEHRTTPRDLAIIARHLIQEFPEYYHLYSEREFTWHEITQHNRNPLLGRAEGVDGMKTGYTRKAAYGLTASAKRGERRLILVVSGLETPQLRASESARLLEWGFREFDNLRLFEAGETVEEASVWLGDLDRVPLVAQEDLVFTVPRSFERDMTVTVTYESPIPAPINKGEELATLRVEGAEIDTIEIPLEAGEDVEQLGAIGRIVSGAQYLVFGAP
jgi:D-alanyl-D-alanine carboxypeptidase (penicillin-binding protein 5/6)